MVGRLQIEIDRKSFENLCGMMCTLNEIAGFFNCSPDTVERWCKREYRVNFADVFKKLSAKGKISLRRNQFKLSEKSAAMAIFLGKQYLNQSDIVTEVDDIAEDALSKSLRELGEGLESDD